MQFLSSSALQPRNICGIFGSFQKLFIVFNRNNDSHRFAIARDDLWFAISGIHRFRLTLCRTDANLNAKSVERRRPITELDGLSRMFFMLNRYGTASGSEGMRPL